MKTQWIILSVIAIVIVLIIYLIKQNLKDKRDLEKFLGENELPIDEEEEFNDGQQNY